MSSNQKRIRDVERMIKRFGNTPDLVAKLEAAKQSKGEVQVKEKMRKNSTKYHMVKFMERKKMTRSIRSVENKIKNEEDAAKLSSLNKKRDELLDDLAYIMYYPMEHKYIALFPSKNKDNAENGDNSDGEEDVEKSKAISKKARQVALQRWKEDQSLGGDKVAYAMEVEYKGGAAAAESAPGKAIAANKEQLRVQQLEKKNKKSAEKKAAKKAPAAVKNNTTEQSTKESADDASSSGSDSSSDSSSSSGSDSDSSDSDSPPTKLAKTSSNANKPTEKKSEATKETTKSVVTKEESEGSDNDNDDFFVEEASESEQINVNAAPKVYQDGNSFRYKEERKNVHEIRFAATKRKFERHQRVFNNKKQHAPRK